VIDLHSFIHSVKSFIQSSHSFINTCVYLRSSGCASALTRLLLNSCFSAFISLSYFSRTPASMRVNVCRCVSMRVDACMCACACQCVFAHVYACIRVHIPINARLSNSPLNSCNSLLNLAIIACVCACACVCVCVCVCVCACVCV